MTKKPYLYDLQAIQVKNAVIEMFKVKFPTAKINSEYLDFHNHICPRCEVELKVYNHTIKKIASVSGFYYTERDEVFLYAICKTCGKEVSTLTPLKQRQHSEKAQRTEENIVSKLNLD